MPRIFAEFLSPRVSHLHQCDPTINCLNFSDLFSKTKGLSFSTTKFNSIINENTKNTIDQITRGNNFEITNENQQNLLHLSVLLGNDELFKKISQNLKNEMSIEERLIEIDFYEEISGSFIDFEFSKYIDDISEYLSSNDLNLMKKT